MRMSQAIATYVAYKQSLGMRFITEARTLKSFYRALDDVEMNEIEPDQVQTFLAGKGPVTRFWHRKFSALRGFYRFALARGFVNYSPLPTTAPKQPPSFIPYIYSRDDIKRLIEATSGLKHCTLSPETFRTLLLLLYGTGLRISEALGLNLADVDLANGLLCVRESKFYKTRWVPTGPDLTRVLAQYLAQRDQRSPNSSDDPFLLTQRGQRLSRTGTEYAFQQLREYAGVHREANARYQPRLHDFRHSFAVTRLTTWYLEGADVQCLLPQLATYLGHVHISGTQRYLTMTPELLRQASLRFERYALGGGHDA